MSNPARPSFREPIESTWGVQVANRVVRRYASAGERDADLAGVADAEGMVVVMLEPDGANYLAVRNGGAWLPAEREAVQRGEGAVFTATDGGGVGVAYPRPFVLANVSIAVSILGPWDNWAVSALITGRTPEGFTFLPLSSAGTGALGVPVSFTWMAAGHLARPPAAAADGPTPAGLADGEWTDRIDTDDDGATVFRPMRPAELDQVARAPVVDLDALRARWGR